MTQPMTKLEIEVTRRVADEMQKLIADGWFRDESEIARLALADFLKRHRYEAIARYQMEDIEWALGRDRKSS